MKVYKFEIGIYDRKIICVLAHSVEEACKLVAERYECWADARYISNIYDSPQIVSVEFCD